MSSLPLCRRMLRRPWTNTRALIHPLKFDYVSSNEAPFDIQSIYHDDKFTYIKTNAPENSACTR